MKWDLRKGIGHFGLFSLYSATWNFWREAFMSRITISTLDWIKRNIFQVTGQSPGWVTLTVSFFSPFFHEEEHSSSFADKLPPSLPCGSWGGEAKPIYIRTGMWSSSSEAAPSLLEVVQKNEYVGTCTFPSAVRLPAALCVSGLRKSSSAFRIIMLWSKVGFFLLHCRSKISKEWFSFYFIFDNIMFFYGIYI